jgi:hypothetical protein
MNVVAILLCVAGVLFVVFLGFNVAAGIKYEKNMREWDKSIPEEQRLELTREQYEELLKNKIVKLPNGHVVTIDPTDASESTILDIFKRK